MAKFEALITDVDKFYASIYNNAKRAAEKVVSDLQQEGPSWTGTFSNSWEISEGNKRVAGDKQAGEPRQLTFPALQPSRRTFKSTDVITFSILNTSPHKDLAMDKIEGVFNRPKDAPIPQTQLGLKKWDPVNEGRRTDTKRGQTGGGNPASSSSRTAPLDWYSTYLGSGKIQKAIQNELGTAVRRLT
jgi:hypothetical protein